MDQFNFFDEGLRYPESQTSTATLVEAPSSRVQSMHLSPTDQIAHFEADPRMRTLDLFDETSDEDELDPQTGAQRASLNPQARMMSPDRPRSYLGGVTPAEYVSQCFHETETPFSPSASSSPRGQSLYAPPIIRHEVIGHNPIPRPNISIGSRGSSPLRNVVRPLTASEVPRSVVDVNTYHLTLSTQFSPRLGSLHEIFANNQSCSRNSNEPAPSPPTKKRLSLAPPPIDFSESRTHLPDTIIKTPYPFNFSVRKSHPKPNTNSASTTFETEPVILLNISRHEGHHCQQRIGQIIIPVNLKGSAKVGRASPKTKQKHLEAWGFDATLFFSKLRYEYAKLIGPFRLFSAHTLQNTRPSYSISCAAGFDVEHASHSQTLTTLSTFSSFPHLP
jgi:hypothetical protein